MKFFIEPKNFGIGFLIGGAAGAATATLYFEPEIKNTRIKTIVQDIKRILPISKNKIANQSQNEITTNKHPALKYGAPTTDINHIRYFKKFIASFDTRTRNPNWVLEYCNYEDASEYKADRSKSEFYEDEKLDIRFRNKLIDFKNSGYDRGHLVPAANHTASQDEMNETFSLMNISPQVGLGFNRDYWARFEKFTRDLIKKNKSVYIVTGPLWLPEKNVKGQYIMNHAMIGEPPAMISVPTHFYKVILAERKIEDKSKNGNCSVAAFVIPNQAINQNIPLVRFAVPITDLESAVGYNFFPLFLNGEKRSVIDNESLKWRSIGKTIALKEEPKLLQFEQRLDNAILSPSQAAMNINNARSTIIQNRKGLTLANATLIEQRLQKEKTRSNKLYICNTEACELPPPDWWKNKTS